MSLELTGVTDGVTSRRRCADGSQSWAGWGGWGVGVTSGGLRTAEFRRGNTPAGDSSVTVEAGEPEEMRAFEVRGAMLLPNDAVKSGEMSRDLAI